ncbi:MAG: serine/threonine protein kinase [Deltaproteobacteria bacterium]|nr:serine/threonine protein kinase [Deltaproteobacteria bacterium]
MLDLRTLERFGPFIVVRPLGRGGMGEVFVARTPWKDDPVAAVKRLRPDVARVTTFTERFRHEAELAVRLHHPNLVGTINVGSVDGQPYVASQLIMGKDTGVVADRLRERRLGAPVAVVIRLLLDVLGALAYVHGARADGKWLALVHRDVTPGNVLVGYDGVARLADFGLAKSLLTEERNLTGHGEILGTPHYLAPEIIQGEKAAPVSDIYGLGAVTYRVLTGLAPHQGTTAEVLFKALSERPRPLGDLRPDLPLWFIEIVHKMLEPDRKKRPYDAALLARQLESRAQQEKLRLQHASVGRWLGQLFTEERDRELSEREEIEAIDRKAFKPRDEGTVVIAQVRPEQRLEPPPPLEISEVDAQGTELDFSDPNLRAELEIERSRNGDEQVRPVSLIDGELDALPTFAAMRAPSVGGAASASGDFPGRGDFVGSIDTAEGIAPRLPGFIDEKAARSFMGTAEDSEGEPPEEELATAVSELAPQRHAMLVQIMGSGDDDTHRPTRRSEPVVEPRPSKRSSSDAEEPLVIPASAASPRTGATPLPRRKEEDIQAKLDRLEGPAATPHEAATIGVSSLSEVRRERGRLGYWAVIVVSAAVAVVAGVGLGVWWSSSPAEVVTMPSPLEGVRARFAATKRRLESYKREGKAIAPEAWEVLTEAGDALLAGDEGRATRALDRVDKAVQ